MSAFWIFARKLLRERVTLAFGMFFAVVSAGGLGVGLLSLAPILELMLGDEPRSLFEIAEDYNQTGPMVAVPDWLLAELPSDPFQGVVLVLVAVGVLTILGALANFGHQFCSLTIAIVTVTRIRLDAFRHAIEMPLGEVFRFGPSEIVSRINKDAMALQSGFTTLLGKSVAQVTKGIASFTVAIIVDWRLTLIAVVLGPLIGVILKTFGRRIRRGSRGSLDAQAELLQVSSEALQGLRAIKTSTAERVSMSKFGRINREVMLQDFKIRTARAVSSPLVEALAVVVVLILAGVASKQILGGTLDVDRFILAIAALAVAGASLRPLANLINDMQAAAAPAQRLLEVLDEPRERRSGSGLQRVPRHAAALQMQGVVVRYPGAERNAVDGIDLRIEHGEAVAIVGPNGCGKTTMLSLIPALLRPVKGRVLIDGVDLAEADLRSLRSQIAVVTQEPVIIQGTVEENIRFGLSRQSREAVEKAARRAHADTFINALPKGYEAPVGEFGSNLSGGQRQRLAIARAMLRDPSILMLDEATSAIDAESEDLINDSIRTFSEGRTVLMIAHRMATIMAADRIVVMNEGRIVDDGTHDELLQRCSLYERLARSVPVG
ncbi:MAG: ABC transporter ATP-binding protein [Phycisphaerales bacterium]|nr:ABC transporter ATP-binding protein [Phycisphaerales bacterium]